MVVIIHSAWPSVGPALARTLGRTLEVIGLAPTKSAVNMIEVQAVGVFFFSHGDEQAFLGWLDAMPFVERLDRSGRTLHIFINESAVDEEGLRELLAMFRRYKVQGLRQLAAFDRDDFADWFRDKEKYWYKEIFG